MTVARLLLFIIASASSALGQGGQVSRGWGVFESRSQHFSVRYPASWHQMVAADGSVDHDTLSIINFPNSEIVSGVIIKKGGASIAALAVPVNAAPSNVRSLEDWIRWYEKHDAVLDDHVIPVVKGAPDACRNLRRIVTRYEVGPNTFQIHTDYFCSTMHGLYVVLLTNWEGDPHQSALQDVALEVALSLRVR